MHHWSHHITEVERWLRQFDPSDPGNRSGVGGRAIPEAPMGDDQEQRRRRKELRKRQRAQREQEKFLREEQRLRREQVRLERQRARLDARRGRGRVVQQADRRPRPQESPDKRALREARRRVNMKIGVAIHAIAYFSVLALILVASRSFRATLIVAMGWGVGFGIHYFVAVVVPAWRKRWVQQEVASQIQQVVPEQRRALEGRHVRSLEDLSASIAHEIRNPISAAKSLVQQMGEDPVSRDNIEYAGVALDELDRVERSISHLLRFARDEELNFESVDMADIVDSALETFRERIQRDGVEVRREIDAPGTLRGDAEKLRRVLINLIGNALDALAGAEVAAPCIEIMSGENLAGSEVWLRIRDNGPGIDANQLDKIFDPFFTTKEHGTGLGLALSKKVIDAHGGVLMVESSGETGTEFVLSFPKRRGAGATNAAPRSGSKAGE